jgi:ornithine cyclodeaminase/alanine dehydrogenase-like protein (mu-crystallin family)
MPNTRPLIFLSHDQLDSLAITTDAVIAAIEDVILGQRDGEVWNAPKATIVPPDDRYMMSTMCASDALGLLAVKSLVLNPSNPSNPSARLPMMNSLITLIDSHTGEPRAVVDGNWVTAIRTAGLSAVAARRLARADAQTIAFIGCGVQATAHLRAFADIFALREVRAFGRGEANRDAFCESGQNIGLSTIAAPSAEDAVRGADIVVTSVTRSPQLEPFLDVNWLAPGSFAAITDLAGPWLPESMAVFDTLVIDDLRQEATMKHPMVDMGLVDGDISGLVSGDFEGRTNSDARTAFVFRGLGLGDLAIAGLAYHVAKTSGTS